ncbi:MAG: lysophospholipid acyltransferase family protein [Edaphobacter sp.]|uniref:lysophospholipid acyltransferase family protein n=1 Tax=Edaphobacter sp. TaxID=1934404 RepID=UPI00239FDD4A|nr:lysophospholipid acyltransferase family protein [Edaphobacter sp.]MDE1175495.1 lysophospholipid acyltransferase family protein [Edaphobacter sp.]
MRLLRSIWRLVCVFLMMAWLAVDLRLRPARDTVDGATRMHRCCRRIVRVLGVRWTTTGEMPMSGAVVSNHLSYLDILLFSAARPFVMVAKSEVATWPLIGWLTKQAGTVYVVRGGGPSTYPAVNRAMAEAFRSGLPVLFFPEGTTTDGAGVLPFRRGLMHSVLREDAALYTAALRYTDERACWWGDATLLPHLIQMAGRNDLRAEIRFGDAAAERRDRFELAASARESVAALYRGLSAQHTELAHPLEHLLDRPVEGVGTFDGHGCVLR